MKHIKTQDPDMYNAITNEKKRQHDHLELIPSENFVSPAVLEAVGSEMINKYAEGYPHKRYYGGNEFIDVSEELAIKRAKQLFSAEHVNVQPYSGSPANMEVYSAMLEFGDKVLAMSLDHGGHLTHGHKVNFSGKAYNFVHYGVNEKGFLDYDKIREIALKEKPKMIISGASAYPRNIDFKKIARIAKEVGAISMADISHISGLIATGIHQNPFPETDIVTTTTHKSIRGPRGALIMCKEEFAKKIDKAVFPGMQGGPHENMIAGKAVAFKEALSDSFKTYAKQIVANAKALSDALKEKGFTICTDGTDNHLLLIDLTNKEVTGKEAEDALDKAGITCNKNMIPFDKRSPFNPSGIRLGTPAVTTRGMKEEDMKKIANWINAIITDRSEENIAKVREEVIGFTKQFPLFKPE